jgi:MbtH protein
VLVTSVDAAGCAVLVKISNYVVHVTRVSDYLSERDMEARALEKNTVFKVVVNHEGHYAIWPDDKHVPEGWRAAGSSGTRDTCLEWVGANWTDMRPLSVRAALSS